MTQSGYPIQNGDEKRESSRKKYEMMTFLVQVCPEIGRYHRDN